jgi:hypothetical protein
VQEFHGTVYNVGVDNTKYDKYTERPPPTAKACADDSLTKVDGPSSGKSLKKV